MFGLSCAAEPMHLEPPNYRTICPVGAPKVLQLEKRLCHSNSATHGLIAFKFCKVVLCGTAEAAELSKPTAKFLTYGPRYLLNH